MKKLMIYGVLVSVISMVHAETVNLNFASTTTSSSSGASESDTVKSVGRGVGINETEALKDAYRDAIERAIGLYVDAETIAKNDEIVKDQILTQSNAYITHYDKIKTTNISGGLVEVRIVATVKKRALTTRVSEAMPGAKIDISSSLGELHAQMVTKENRSQDGAALLENVLKDLDLSKLLRVSLVSNKPEVANASNEISRRGQRFRSNKRQSSNGRNRSQDKIRLGYLFKFEIDKERYFKEVLPPIKEVMDQISITSPKTIRFNVTGEDDSYTYSTYLSYRDCYLKAGEKFEEQLHTMRCTSCANGNCGFYDDIKRFTTAFPGCKGDLEIEYGNANTLGVGQDQYLKNGLVVVLITDVNAGGLKGVKYTLDFESARILNKWHSEYAGGFGGIRGKVLQYDILFKEDSGCEVLSHTWNFNQSSGGGGGCGVGWNACFTRIPLKERWEGRDEKAPEYLWILTPFIGACAERYVEWHAFDMNKDDLVKIKKISIERVEQ